MSHLEDPHVEVSVLTNSDDYRVIIEAECVKLKFDVSIHTLLRIAEEALEAISDHNDAVDECEFCLEGRCDLSHVLIDAVESLKKKHAVRR